MVKIRKGIWYTRFVLPAWFLLLAAWTVVSPKTGIKVLSAYINAERECDDEYPLG